VRARTQTQVAVTSDHESWILLNCSPDLRSQIETTPELHSQPTNGLRQSPIAGAILTSADIDCVLGLLHLREQQPLELYATATVCKIIREGNSLFKMLEQKPEQTRWTPIEPGNLISAAGISFRAIPTGGDYPYYVQNGSRSGLAEDSAVIGLIAGTHGAKFAFLPGVREIPNETLKLLDSCDLLLMDGTFWTDDELIRIQGGGRTAREMGHMPVSGSDGSIERFREVRRPRKVFIHINNTNPMLNENGPEYRQVRDAGWEIAHDGDQFVIGDL
jgi:pyrroloquinoline quinone biosynthesis protein B